MFISLVSDGTIFECADFRTAYRASRSQCRSCMYLHGGVSYGATIYYSDESFGCFAVFRDNVHAGRAYAVAQYELDSNDGESFWKLHWRR